MQNFCIVNFKLSHDFLAEFQQLYPDETIQTLLFSVWLVYLYRIGNKETLGLDVNWSDREAFNFSPEGEESQNALSHLIAPTVPFMLDLSDDLHFEQVLSRVKAQKEILQKHQTYLTDLLVRYPDINKAYIAPAVGVIFTDTISDKIALSHPITLHVAQNGLAIYSTKNALNENLIQFIKNSQGHLQTLLEGIAKTPETPISHLPLLTKAEQQQILVEWNQTKTDYPRDKTVHQLFEEQVEKTPDNVAVVFENEQLTYRVLNEKANQLAHYLQKQGLKAGQSVALCVERNLEMVIGILAIIKAGGVYVPIDPEYPEERIQYMLGDSEAVLMLTQSIFFKRFSAALLGGRKIILLDGGFATTSEKPFVAPNMSSNDPLYIMYTSGSTGLPKGVVVSHRNVTRLIKNTNYIDIDHTDVLAQASNIAFDAATFEIWGALLNGAKLVIISKSQLLNTSAFLEVIIDYQVSVLFLTTALFNEFCRHSPDGLYGVKKLLMGGEKINTETVKSFMHSRNGKSNFMHIYGPTECTTFSVCCLVNEDSLAHNSIPIGKPISNTHCYVLDAQLQPVPIGISGELCIGGDGVSKGYFNQPAKTAEKFISNPFSNDTHDRLYWTGDIVRWLSDGNLEYMGREDDQIKLRGFRIELGEIEAILMQHPQVSQAVAVIHRLADNRKQLEAYCIAKEWFDVVELKNYLQQKLPVYMVPSRFFEVDNFPLTPNGKVDRKALIKNQSAFRSIKDLKEACSSAEATLVEIWKKTLNITDVGIDDNFFALGGDSIIAMQVVSKASQAGLLLSIQDLFKYPTIEDLAKCINLKNSSQRHQDEPMGWDVPFALAPIQQWFFNQHFKHQSIFSQVCLLTLSFSPDIDLLRRCLGLLVKKHPALQLCFTYQDDHWQQSYQSDLEEFCNVLEVIDVSKDSTASIDALIAQWAHQLQGSFDLKNPSLFKAVLFVGKNKASKLLMAAHHLIIDGVSWRILLSELSSLYSKKGHADNALTSGTSYQAWIKALHNYRLSDDFEAEKSFWLDRLNRLSYQLPRDQKYSGGNFEKDSKIIQIELTEAETTQWLQALPLSLSVKSHEILIALLIKALAQWSNTDQLVIDLESHGREEWFDGLSLSETVGWFTSLFPAHFTFDKEASLETIIKSVQQQLNAIPYHGIGYGLLRDSKNLSITQTSEVVFNYWGQLDQMVDAEHFTFESLKLVSHPDNLRTHLLSIEAVVEQGKLRLLWTYNANFHYAETIEKLANHYLQDLRNLIHSQDATDRIYPLFPLQKGLLFHGVYSVDSEAYMTQLIWKSPKTIALNLAVLKKAFESIVVRHDALRAYFVWEGLEEPLQQIKASVDIPWQVYDWRNGEFECDFEERLSAFLKVDREVGFQFSEAPLLRVTVIAIPEQQHYIILTVHHILLDGWSLPILLEELETYYQAGLRGSVVYLPRPQSHAKYIQWLKNQNDATAKTFWAEYLQDYSGVMMDWALDALSVPSKTPTLAETQIGSVDIRLEERILSGDFLIKVKQFCQQQAITLNTLFQGLWALLLHHYSQDETVVFGVTFAGRPPEISGIEDMVGLFINTLPLRVDFESLICVKEYLISIQNNSSKISAYQATSLTELQRWANLTNNAALFNTILIFENYPITEQTDHLFKFKDIRIIDPTHYPLSCVIIPGDQLTMRLAFDQQQLEASKVKHLANHFHHLLTQMIQSPEKNIHHLDLLTAQECQQILVDWNQTQVDYPHDKAVYQLFEAQVEKTPDNIAIIFEEQSLSYRALNARANQLAHYLQQQGIKTESLVALCVERGLEMIISILGILKAGAAYVPIDPEYPLDRIHYVLENCQPDLLITQKRFWQMFETSDFVANKLVYTDNLEVFAEQSSENPAVKAMPDQLMYVLYTSGSTGRPKGVFIEHRSVVNFLFAMISEIQPTAEDRLLAVTPITFDISGLEFYLPLLVGACSVIASRDTTMDGVALREMLEQQNISILQATPMTWKLLLEASWVGSFTLKALCGGEALSSTLAQQLRPRVNQLWNLYGPTETTIWSTIYPVITSEAMNAIVPIGKPIANTQVYVLNTHHQPVPVGVIGELYIGGDGLARGYLNQLEQMQERFIKSFLVNELGTRLYKTGDQVRWLSDGQLEYVGRNDDQIKLNGFRIELNEIQAVLEKYSAVKQAAVIVYENKKNEKKLAAFIVPNCCDVVTGLDYSLFYFGSSDIYHKDTENPYSLYLESIKYADQAGFKAVWTPERHFHKVGGYYPNPAVLNAAVATMTKQIALRAGSVVLPLHNPLRIVEEWSVVDNLSGGRVGIGFASGWNPKDFAFFPENYPIRKEIMQRDLEQVKALWRGEAIQIIDGLGKPCEVNVFPKPQQKELPIWITAASNPETFIEAGKMGANLLTHLLGQTVEELAKKIALYHDALEEAGYQRSEKIVTLMLHTFVWHNSTEAVEICRKPFSDYLRDHVSLATMAKSLDKDANDYSEADIDELIDIAFNRYIYTASLIGGVEDCLERAKKLKVEGVNEIACLIDFGIEPEQVLKSLEYLNQLRVRSQKLVHLAQRTLVNYLKHALPNYMVPKVYINLDTLPLTPNGKIDKKLLQSMISDEQRLQVISYIAPQTNIQEKLAAIWSESLEIFPIGIHDNFFERGGYSLLALQMLGKINQQFNVNLRVHALFSAPTIAEFARLLEAALNKTLDISAAKKKIIDALNCLVPLRVQGNKTPLFLVHPVGGTIFWYTRLIKYLDPDHPVYGIQDPGIHTDEIPFQSMEEMAAYYVSVIRSIQSNGPYLLGGASSGGNISVEIACQLEKLGQPISFLGLMDAWVPCPDALLNQEFFETIMRGQYKNMHDKFASKGIFQADSLLNLQWQRMQMYSQYQTPSINFKLTLFKAADTISVYRTIEDSFNHWEYYASQSVTLYQVPGDHETMFQEPNVAVLANCLNKCLNIKNAYTVEKRLV